MGDTGLSLQPANTTCQIHLPSGTFQPRRYKPGNMGNWSGHLPFARDLVLSVRPSLLVELGTHWGESYFGFCQAIAESDIACLAYSVDTWIGEAHSGIYDETVYKDVAAYNQANYGSFSYLLRTLFDDALGKFADDSIDILHIDGLHTLEAVSRDFSAWLPKVKPGGIILLHDIAAKHADFAVWQLWEELKEKAATFEFHHSWGLGVFEKPKSARPRPPFLELLLASDSATQQHVRRFYSLAALELEWKHSRGAFATGGQNEDHLIQLFYPLLDGYFEEASQKIRVVTNEWQHITFELPVGILDAPLRIDFPDCPAIIDVRGITIRSSFDGKTLWSTEDSELSALRVGGMLMSLNELGNGVSRFFSYGPDPQLYLPHLDSEQFDQPLSLDLWMRFRTGLSDLAPLIQGRADLLAQHASLHERILELEKQCSQLENDKLALRSELTAHQTNTIELQKHCAQLEREKDAMLADKNAVLADKNAVLADYDHARARNAELEDKIEALERGRTEQIEANKALEDTLSNIVNSRSWRLTDPLRRAMYLLKGKESL